MAAILTPAVQSNPVMFWNQQPGTTPDAIKISAGPRLRTAMILAILADLLQLVIFPLVVEGAASPADDALDLAMAAILSYLLGWHWEFLPSFLAKLVPGVDLFPCWTIAIANVYRTQKRIAVGAQDFHNDNQSHSTPRNS
jgi:hypothetical protein